MGAVYYGPFCVALVCVCMRSVFCLLSLSYQYLPSDWLERLLKGSLIGLSPQSPAEDCYDFFGLVYCFIFYCVFVSCLLALYT